MTIDEVVNLTKRKVDWKTQEKLPKTEGEIPSTPNVAEKLVDKIISEYPDLTIKWDATTPQGMNFKRQYLEKHPELQNRTQGISTMEELDRSIENDYNAREGAFDEGSNRNNEQLSLEGGTGEIQATNSTERKFNSSTKSNNDNIRDTLPSDSPTNAGRKITTADSSQSKLDFNTKLTYQTTNDIVSDLSSGDIKLNSVENIEAVVAKSIECLRRLRL